MKSKLSFILLSISLFGCPINPKPKPPVPTPTPPVSEVGRPTIPIGLDLLLRVKDSKFIRNNSSHSVVGAIPCWPPDNTGDKLYLDGELIQYWWPLVSPDWIVKTTPKGVNAFHIRPGPFDSSESCCGMEEIGGPYAPDKSWNTKFWDRYHVALRQAVKSKGNVEVDVLDGWIIKHAVYGDVKMPWPSEDINSASKLPFNESVKSWVKKNIYESCNYGNVIYQIGNENNLMVGWTPEWERAMFNLIRESEQQEGCKQIVHLIGSNTKDWDGPYDYFSSHDAREGDNPIAGRPVSVNEYNPHITPSSFHAKFCSAKKNGQAFWYWRSDGSNQDQDASLNSLDCDSSPVSSCPAPLPPREKLTIRLNCSDTGICDSTPVVEGVHDYCASIGMGDFFGQPRFGCPMRNECPDTPGYEGMCEDRLPCEQYAIQSPAPIFTTDGRLDYLGYPSELAFRVRCYECSWIQVCDGTGKVCTKHTF